MDGDTWNEPKSSNESIYSTDSVETVSINEDLIDDPEIEVIQVIRKKNPDISKLILSEQAPRTSGNIHQMATYQSTKF